MRTLFVSDLDGTLLGQDGHLSERTVQLMNRLLDDGVHFSFATARTASTALSLTARLNLTAPVILQNGVLVLDPITRIPLRKWSLPQRVLPEILRILEAYTAPAFVYTMGDRAEIHAYYAKESPEMTVFRIERQDTFEKKFTQVESLAHAPLSDVTYLTMMDRKENLDPVYHALLALPVHAQYYRDVYHKDVWFLEVYHREASKGRALAELRTHVKADIVVAFGDNYNDLSLFEAAHHRVAVGNAVPELLAAADAVIEPNHRDSVPRYIAQYRKAHYGTR